MRRLKIAVMTALLTLVMLGTTAIAQSTATVMSLDGSKTLTVTVENPTARWIPTVGSSSVPFSGAMAPVPAMSVVPAMAPVASEPPKLAMKAATDKQDPWWKVLIGGLLEILLVFVLAIAIVCGRLLVKYIAKQIGVTDKEEIGRMNALYDSAVTFGVNYATQQAHKLRDNPDSKGKRLDWAITKAEELIREYKLPEKTAMWIASKIEAKIGEKERKYGFTELISGESIKSVSDPD